MSPSERTNAPDGTDTTTVDAARPSSKGPIFVTGFQRSGTTLLGNMIDRHPEIAVFLESFFIPRYQILQFFYWPLTNPRNCQKLAHAIAAEPSALENGLRGDLGDHADQLTTYGQIVEMLMRRWAEQHGKHRWGDKSPGYVTKLRTLAKVCPNAKFVHIIRDGRDVWLSVKRLGWESNVVTLARQWRRAVRRARREGRSELAGHYFECQYETLTQEPAEHLRRIFEFLGESYSPDLLSAEGAAQRNPSFKAWPKIHDAIDPTNTAKWKSQLPIDEVALFENEAGDLLEELGYTLSGEPLRPALRARRFYLLATSTVQRAVGIVWRGAKFVVRAIRMRFSSSLDGGSRQA